MIDGITPLHLVLVLVIALIVIGPGKLPGVGKAIGESIREFRKATSDVKEAVSLEPISTPAGGPVVVTPIATSAAAPVQPATTRPLANQKPENDAKV